MRKRHVSDGELNQVIKLKQSGASWMMIQNQTGVPRRSAQKAYDDWQRSQSIEELKAARVDVAAEEFRKHVDQLINLVESLAGGLNVPETPKTTINAEDYLDLLLEKIYREIKGYNLIQTIENRERKRFLREYHMLLKSLEYHTREKVHWQLLEQWEKAWNDCTDHLNNYESEVDTVASNITDKDAHLIETINDQTKQKTAEIMAQVVLDVIWQKITNGTLDPESPGIDISFNLVDRMVTRHIKKDLFKRLGEIMSQVAETFCIERKEDIIQPLLDTISRLNEVISVLEEMLNPLVLRPLILRTRCDLCPA